jgi:polyisoprenoid-binding protein YceI
MKKGLLGFLMLLLSSYAAQAEYYQIDTKGAHAFIEFRIQHLGFSWMSGRFNTFTGHYSYDENNSAKARVEVDIDVTSIDTNHAERDKHLRGDKFLNTDEFPKASFISTSFDQKEDGTAVLTGDFTLHGVTKSIDIDVEPVGQGNDPWGGYRRGFVGTTEFTIADYGIDVAKLGPSSQLIFLTLSIEGIRRSITDEAEGVKPF